MACEHRTRRRVEFSETDMAGIVHYSCFFKYMEHAEHDFYRSLGFSVVPRGYDPPIGFPRVHVDCDFRRPIRFEDVIDIHLVVTEKRAKSLSYRFTFTKREEGREVTVAVGHLVVVCAAKGADGQMKATAIPEDIANKIEAAPAAPSIGGGASEKCEA